MTNVTRLQDLISTFEKMNKLDGYTKQSRGVQFNKLIADMLCCWGIDAKESIRSKGEIDVAFTLEGTRYLVEAKWEREKSDTGKIGKLQRRVKQRFAGTVGIFISMAGYSAEAVSEVSIGERLEVLLLDRQHFELMLSGIVPPREMIELLENRASFSGDAYFASQDVLEFDHSLPAIHFYSGFDGGYLDALKPGVFARTLFTVSDSERISIAYTPKGRILFLHHNGIIEVDTIERRAEWIARIPRCSDIYLSDDGVIYFARQSGVGKIEGRKISAIGGGYSGAVRLFGGPTGEPWVLSNGEPDGIEATSVSRLGNALGDERRCPVDYPASFAMNAAWLSSEVLLICGSAGLSTYTPDLETIHAFPAGQSNPMGLIPLSDNKVISVGDDVSLVVTDMNSGNYAKVAHLALRASVNDVTQARDGSVLLAAYCQGMDLYSVAVTQLSFTPSKEVFGDNAFERLPLPAERSSDKTLQERVARLSSLQFQRAEEERRNAASSAYNQIIGWVHKRIYEVISSTISDFGLQSSMARDIIAYSGWAPVDYGGSVSFQYWGFNAVKGICIAFSAGVVHRSRPVVDLDDLRIVVGLTECTTTNQHHYLTKSVEVDANMDDVETQGSGLLEEVLNELPSIIDEFVSACEERANFF